ncbi:MAG: polysaccharide biosynthesis protein, partial [Flavobacteriales bacterium]
MIKDLLAFVNRGTPRGVLARKNILASILIKGGSVLISLALVPLIIRYLDTTRYGIWITVTYMVSWLGLFDIGLGHGLRNRLAEALASGNRQLARSYLSTTYALLIIIIIP